GAVAAGAERDVRAAAALVPLRGHDLVVVVAEVHAVGRPGVEVVARRDGATGALLLAHAPVLRERRAVALDRRGVVAHRPVDVVGAAVGGDGALVVARGPVGAPVVDHVVLDQRAAGPSVQREVGVAGRGERPRVGHGASGPG